MKKKIWMVISLMLIPWVCFAAINASSSGGGGSVLRGTVANAPVCNSGNLGLVYIVTDAATTSDCGTGGGVAVNDCICDGTNFVDVDNASGGGAPTDATYITQTTNATLTAEQALSALGNGLLRHTGGVVATAAAGTDYVAPAGNVATATALAANPTDCGVNQFAQAIAANGNLTCAGIVDADVPDTITVSNYLPLAGGTMTGAITLDELGIIATTVTPVPECDDPTDPQRIYFSTDNTRWERCENGNIYPFFTTTPGLTAVKNIQNVINNANDANTAFDITRAGGTCGVTDSCIRQYVDSGQNPVLQFLDGSGNPLSTDLTAWTGQDVSINCDNGGTPQSCWDFGPTGVLTISGNQSSGSVVGNVAVQGTVQSRTAIRTISTTPYTMVEGDCGRMLFIATGAGEIDLLADMTGCMLCIMQVNAVQIDLDPNGTDTISAVAAGLSLSAGDRLRLASGVDNHVCVIGQNDTTIRTMPGIGALSDAN